MSSVSFYGHVLLFRVLVYIVKGLTPVWTSNNFEEAGERGRGEH